MEAPHQEVHRYGQEAVRAHRAGEIDATLASIERMERASLAVLEHLERIAVSGERDPGVLCSADH